MQPYEVFLGAGASQPKAACFSPSPLHQDEYHVEIACHSTGYYKPVDTADAMIKHFYMPPSSQCLLQERF